MANTDPVEWRLLDDDFTTVLGILPSDGGNLYLELNEAGSGEIKIPRDSAIASTVTVGMFAQCLYRGAARGGFLIDNVQVVDANAQEGGGQLISLSGRGPLGILEDAIIWDDGTGASSRTFTGTKASILIDLIDEAIARNAITNVVYDFSETVDSDAVSWDDAESLSLAVGTSLLDLIHQFSESGIDFNMNVETNGDFTLQAFKNGAGSDLSATVYFRVGTNCEEVSETKLGTKIKNVIKLKYRDGFANVTDSTSAIAYRRREAIENIEAAQSVASATTYGSAKLATLKDPKRSLPIRVYDGVTPYAFVSYNVGDYIKIDRFGVEASERIRGMQMSFVESGFASIVITLNDTIVESDIDFGRDLDWLKKQWNTARDAKLMEVRSWINLGLPGDDITTINCFYVDGNSIYVGGRFRKIGGIVASNAAKLDISTGVWSAVATGSAGLFASTATVRAICRIGDTTYMGGGVSDKVWKIQDGGSITAFGTFTVDPLIDVYAMATDGTDLFIGGNFSEINSVSDTEGIAKYVVATDTWEAVGAGINGVVLSLLVDGSSLYAGGNFLDASGVANTLNIAKFASGAWSALGTGRDGYVYALAVQGTDIYAGGAFTGKVAYYNGSAWDLLGGGLNNTVYSLAIYVTDVYAGGDFTDYGSRIARYSGGNWWALEGGLNDTCFAVALYGSSVYAGGEFTLAGTDEPVNKGAVYYTSFDDLIGGIGKKGSGYDLGAGIHNAVATTAMAGDDEVPLWQNATSLLRKITWSNILLSIKTYTDGLYVALTGNQTVAGVKTFSSDPIIPDEAYDATTWNGSLEPPTKNAVRDKIESMGGGGTPGGADTNIQYNNAGAFGGSSDFVRNANGSILIGTPDTAITQDAYSIHQGSDGVSVANFLQTFGTAVASFITFVRGRGTHSSPTAVQADDVIGRIRGRAYDGAGSLGNTSAEMQIAANQTHSSTAHGTRVEFYTTPDSSTTLTKAFTIRADGSVNVETGKQYLVNGAQHTHAGADITSGTVAAARLGSGTADVDRVLHGDNTWDYLKVGTYTPTLYNTTNVAASTSYQANYIRFGNLCMVYGVVDVDPTAAAQTVLGMSIPIASAFTGSEAAGVGYGGPTEPIRVVTDATNDRVSLVWTAVQLVNHTCSYNFLYEIK